MCSATNLYDWVKQSTSWKRLCQLYCSNWSSQHSLFEILQVKECVDVYQIKLKDLLWFCSCFKRKKLVIEQNRNEQQSKRKAFEIVSTTDSDLSYSKRIVSSI
jgi:hypothetical protein